MRLSVSVALWLIAISVLVLGVHGTWQLSEEERDLYDAVERELTLVATAVRSGVENAVRDDQEADIGALLEQLELKDPAFDVFVFRGDHELLGSSWGSVTNLDRARGLVDRSPDRGALEVRRLEDGDVAVVAPFAARGRLEGQLVILRSPNALRLDLAEERRGVLLSIGVVTAVIAAGIWFVLHVRLQRPISRIADAAHRVARGDLTARSAWAGSDELAMLSREFDAMVQSLEGARAQLARETETRERLEADMLRANRLVIVGELAATLAHEVGSPLQVLGGRAREIAARADLPAEVGRSAAALVQQVDRVHLIVERFLDVARRKAPIFREVDLRVVVAEVGELLRAQYRHRGVRLAMDLPVTCRLEADPAQLQQVLLNLLQNALRASQRGDVVHVRAAPSSFSRHPGGALQSSIELSVEDQGPGVPPELAERVFEPFFTGWHAASRDAAGTGLGLSVVRTILLDHGGLVEVRAGGDGRGACFVAHFPVERGRAPATSERTP